MEGRSGEEEKMTQTHKKFWIARFDNRIEAADLPLREAASLRPKMSLFNGRSTRKDAKTDATKDAEWSHAMYVR